MEEQNAWFRAELAGVRSGTAANPDNRSGIAVMDSGREFQQERLARPGEP